MFLSRLLLALRSATRLRAQPAARAHFVPDRAGEFDCIVCYDMPGITFTGAEPPAVFEEPTRELVTA